MPEGVWERRLKLLKEMGCNGIRTSHNPPAPEFLALCDRMGFLVMDEAFDEWTVCKVKNIKQRGESSGHGYAEYFDRCGESDLREMLMRDRNHPSVFLWSIGNEIPSSLSKRERKSRKGLRISAASLTNTGVTSACDRIAAEPDATRDEFLAELDVVGYNYVDRWRERTETFYAEDRHAFPAGA